MKNKQATLSIISVVILSCIIMALVEVLIVPNYFAKSLIKICIFLILPLIVCIKDKSISFKALFKGSKKAYFLHLYLA